MAAVLIACPTTGSLVPVGVQAGDLADLAPRNVLAECPDCGGRHEWTPIDAVLTGAGDSHARV